ncbi:MAG: prepilin-type N-terminal cleavage/methylation domain-containing protein [Pirellulaceae bacterium]
MTRLRQASAFSLVEVLVALTILGMAGAALLLATEAAATATDDALERTIAQGVAQQYIDDCLGNRYVEAGVSPELPWLGRENGEHAWPLKTALFDDTDDFNGYESYPLRDSWAVALGQGDAQGSTRHPQFQLRSDYFDRWFTRIRVHYVDADQPAKNLPSGQTSGFRAVEVEVGRVLPNGSIRVLSQLRRVYSYVPSPS